MGHVTRCCVLLFSTTGCGLPIAPADSGIRYEFENGCTEAVVVTVAGGGPTRLLDMGDRSFIGLLDQSATESKFRVTRPDNSGLVEFFVEEASFVLSGDRCPAG